MKGAHRQFALYAGSQTTLHLEIWRRKSSLSHSLQAKSLGMRQSCFALKNTETPCSAKVSKSQIQKGKMPLTCLLLCSFLYQEHRNTYFFETSVLFHHSSGAKSSCQHCWCLLCPVRHEDREPRRNDLKLKKMLLPFSILCKDIITSVPFSYPAKSSPACTSKKEEVACFAANTIFMPRLRGLI